MRKKGLSMAHLYCPFSIERDGKPLNKFLKDRIKIDRNEIAGAFGDLGTFVPFVLGVITFCNISATSLLFAFGLSYVFSGLIYGSPIPIQPMKYIAGLTIAEQLPPEVVAGSGFFVGAFFLISAIIGLIDWIEKTIPKAVVGGIQMAVGLKMIMLALNTMFPIPESNGAFMGVFYLPIDWILAIIGIIIVFALLKNDRIPPMLIILPLFASLSILNAPSLSFLIDSIGIHLPRITIPSVNNILTGAILLAIPQIPLTTGNAIIAMSSLHRSLFPKRRVSAKRLSLSMGGLNILSALLGGIPVCHGVGGLAGHYRFGARTGGSLIVIGSLLLFLGALYGDSIVQMLSLLPSSFIGILSFFAGLELLFAIRDLKNEGKGELLIITLVATISIGIKYGFMIGLIVGTLVSFVMNRVCHSSCKQNDR